MKYDYPDTLIKNPSTKTVGKATISSRLTGDRGNVLKSEEFHVFFFTSSSFVRSSLTRPLIFIIYEALRGFMEFFSFYVGKSALCVYRTQPPSSRTVIYENVETDLKEIMTFCKEKRAFRLLPDTS